MAIAVVVLAYLLGSINFAVIFSKVFMKKDVREVGSGNAGTTNVMRSAGFVPGALTFLCDALKGFAACYVGKIVFQMLSETHGDDLGILGAYICGLLCMIGHVFPVFFKFKGGKGVATSVGIFAVCAPVAIVLGLAVFAVITSTTKYVSLASLSATVVVVVTSVIFRLTDGYLIWQIVLAVAMGIIVFLKHKDNVKRLLNGTENKVGGKKNV
jgi:glycerol-3-phosphate acyltransferase PlsY